MSRQAWLFPVWQEHATILIKLINRHDNRYPILFLVLSNVSYPHSTKIPDKIWATINSLSKLLPVKTAAAAAADVTVIVCPFTRFMKQFVPEHAALLGNVHTWNQASTLLFFFQIYVEIERARLTRILATIREGQGNIAEAANVLQELQVCVIVIVKHHIKIGISLVHCCVWEVLSLIKL